MGQPSFAVRIAHNITALLTERSLAAYTLADLSGIARTTMQRRLIDGEFTVNELVRVADVLDVDYLAILRSAQDAA